VTWTRRRILRWTATWLLAALVVQYLVLPQLAGARRAAGILGDLEPALLALAVGLELAALAAYAELTRSLLPADGPGRLTVLRINLTTRAVSHVVPGGNAAGAAVGLDLLRTKGVAVSDATLALATQSVGSAVVLNVLLWCALVASVPARGFDPAYATAAGLGAVLIAGVAAAAMAVGRGREGPARAVGRWGGRLPFVDGRALESGVRRFTGRLRTVLADRALLLRASGWAAASWLLSAASLWVALAAFGHRSSITGLLVAFGLANVAAAIPITPGGLGVLDATLVATLVAFGAPADTALLGVAGWRLVNFWLPIPLGVASYVSLRIGRTVADTVVVAATVRAEGQRTDPAPE
jgi:uncharacterized protein (TIRG00374 family)